tara:strand:- start:2132 stop:2335 length:204 start_codon:yes stop_codon:yes gene_type:complete
MKNNELKIMRSNAIHLILSDLRNIAVANLDNDNLAKFSSVNLSMEFIDEDGQLVEILELTGQKIESE